MTLPRPRADGRARSAAGARLAKSGQLSLGAAMSGATVGGADFPVVRDVGARNLPKHGNGRCPGAGRSASWGLHADASSPLRAAFLILSGQCVAVISLSLIAAFKTMPITTAIAIFFIEPSCRGSARRKTRTASLCCDRYRNVWCSFDPAAKSCDLRSSSLPASCGRSRLCPEHDHRTSGDADCLRTNVPTRVRCRRVHHALRPLKGEYCMRIFSSL